MFKLYGKFFAIHLRSQMQYKTSFILTVLGQCLTSFGAFLSIYFLFARFHQVEGFVFQEVLLCHAVVLLSFSLAEIVFRGFDTFAGIISRGEFDRFLLEPRSPMFRTLCTRMEFSRLGRLAEAGIVMAYALSTGVVVWNWAKAGVLLLMLVCGTLLFAGLFTVYASFCFFSIQGLEFMNIFTDGGREFGQYPFTVYGRRILRFFTYIIPLACVQYYPLLYLLDRAPSPWYALIPLGALLFLVPSTLFWRLGVRHYKSSGS